MLIDIEQAELYGNSLNSLIICWYL